ncbi:glutamate synthase [NADPH] large chain [Vibrio astriarenae]|nr:glutamate synthase [NADPH] large chain [Vibrio sp. C7]
MVDTKQGKLWQSEEIDHDLKSRHPYKEWMTNNVQSLKPLSELSDESVGARSLMTTCSPRIKSSLR